MDKKYRVWVSQLHGFVGRSEVSGYLDAGCGLVRAPQDAAEWTLEQVAGALETFSYEGCELVEMRLTAIEVSSGAAVAPKVEQAAGAGSIDLANVRRLAAKLQNYDTCNDDDIDEAAKLLLHLDRVMRDRI